MTTLEHYQHDLVDDQPVMAWVVWDTFEDEELADLVDIAGDAGHQ